MLQRIIRAILFSIPLAAFIGLACQSEEQSLLRFYYATNTDYQSYLEDVQSFGQATIPISHSPWNLKDPQQIARVLRMRLDPALWSNDQVRRLAEHVVRLSHRYHFPPALILSMIEVESRLVPTAVSGHGAVGLMQVMPSTGERLAAELSMPWDAKKSLRDPLTNIELGLQYMVQLRARFKQPRRYLTAYNIGPSALLRKLKSGEPYSERYYNKVMRSYHEYATRAL